MSTPQAILLRLNSTRFKRILFKAGPLGPKRFLTRVNIALLQNISAYKHNLWEIFWPFVHVVHVPYEHLACFFRYQVSAVLT